MEISWSSKHLHPPLAPHVLKYHVLVPGWFPDAASTGGNGPLFLVEPISPMFSCGGAADGVYGVLPVLFHFILMTVLRGQSFIPFFSGPEAETKRGCKPSQRLTTCKWLQDSGPGFPDSRSHDLPGTVWWLKDSGVTLCWWLGLQASTFGLCAIFHQTQDV